MLRSRMLILPSKSQMGERAGFEPPELLERGRRVGKQEGLALRIFGHLNSSIVNPIVDPVGCEAQRWGDLRHRQVAGDPPWVRLMALEEDAVAQADDPDGVG